ncbi:hypothetical protein [Parafrankia sp. BMG5.11]|uniref:hypothetical protein n=1 Tax=Parafrankia sp. BMG5.11 TaxID=222540 RepID=UPI00103F3066|nr:hypothetical protein [Parafrankia sp. BMG5.11]TCJ35199.1 hypothetical protein E0504_29360 [Parafrankia sp. BMG5.11]
MIHKHLIDAGLREEVDEERQLKDKVSRALTGRTLVAETLDWFIEAFNMDEGDADHLRAMFAGTSAEINGISSTVRQPRSMARRQWHRTLSLFERYHIDARGYLVERRTMHTILALENNVDRYLFNHEPTVVDIQVIRGGQLGRRYEYSNGLCAHDIDFGYSLSRGQSYSFEYSAFYAEADRRLEIRRPARARSENIDIAVCFQPELAPRRIWWSVWEDHYDGGPVDEDPVQLDGSLIARRYVSFIEQTVVGFRWEY